MGEPKTRTAVNCPDCSLVERPHTDPLTALRRLPAALWNLTPPTQPFLAALLAGDEVDDTTVFGPLGSTDATPQYEVARILVDERDRFVQAWKQTEANQLGLGDAVVTGNQFVSTGPRASGGDLDQLLEQYGIPRPFGFTDCCYWRLYELLLWQPGNPAWLMLEIAELYTGVRPAAVESRSKIILVWPTQDAPSVPGTTFTNYRGFANRTAFAGGDQPAASIAYSVFAGSDPMGIGYGFAGATSDRLPAAGLTLLQALQIVKPVGVYVDMVNAPLGGSCGCLGATTRVPASIRGFIGAAPEDV